MNDEEVEKEIKEREENRKNGTNLHAVSDRIKNLARDWDATLTPIGESLCNLYTHVLLSFYEYAESLPEPYKNSLVNLIRSNESFPRKVIELNKKKKK